MNGNVSFNITELLKTKKFKFSYCRYDYLLCPSIVKVIMWLYEQHNIWVSVTPYNDEEHSQTLWENKIILINDEYNDCSDYTFYHSPKEAYEAAIEYVLTKLI